MIHIIVALNKKRVIGDGTTLLWHLPEDLKRFHEKTNGHPVVMGRKTWESLPPKRRPLSDRTNIVISSDPHYGAPGAEVVTSFEDALARARQAPGGDTVWVIGGERVFKEALPVVDRVYATMVEDDQEPEGAVHFPPIDDFEVIPNEDAADDGLHEHEGKGYWFVTLVPPSAKAA